MGEVFHLRQSHYNLRNYRELHNDIKNTVKYGIESVAYKSGQIWEKLPQRYKSISSLSIFKSSIKEILNELCQCRLCRNFIANIGFMD